MAQNIELKANVANRAELEQKVIVLVGNATAQLVQRDVYYGIRKGRLKYRTINNRQHELIYYNRPNTVEAKKSTFYKFNLWFPKLTHGILKTLYGETGIVEKERTLYMLDNIRIHLDDVKGLGHCMEFEYLVDAQHTEDMGKQRLLQLKEQLALPDYSILTHSYVDIAAQRL
ncbi:MAG: class IV adenylate cyclase [Sphingobacteriales bacterium JAD_PAG50586_3]|nr:MAG: class IV adenylate cyclase [Sphingobacteriales bacterium JAD_PAG50586_3]